MRLPLLLAFVGAAVSPAQPADWKVGLASVDITPGEPLPMAGYAGRRQPFEAVEQPLFAKALALEDGAGKRALLITADILGFTAERSRNIADRLRESDGIAREDILFNASHTHSGPLIAGSMLTGVDARNRRKLERYIRIFEDKTASAARDALQDLQPANLSWGQGAAAFVMNRRQFTERGIVLGTNARGPADRTVPVLRIDDAGGRLRAVVFGAAAHCTTLGGDNMRISGDYAGFAQQFLEARRPDVQAMFLTGCAGDANPYPRGTFDLARRHGSGLAEEVVRVLQGGLRRVRGPLKTEFELVPLPLKRHTRAEIEAMSRGAPSYRRFFTAGALAKLDRGETLRETYTAPFALWQFGGDLTLAAYSGETPVDYALAAERLLGPLKLWVSGYNNDVFGYLPSARLLAEGGYETRGLYVDYGLFEPAVEQVVLDALLRMADRTGR